MNRKEMIELMEKLGLYEGPGYFSTEPNNGAFIKIESAITHDLLRSPLEPVRFSICEGDKGRLLRILTYRNLDMCLEREMPATAAILRREYDPLEGLDIPATGKKKSKKENRKRAYIRELSREITRCIAALYPMEPALGQ